MQVGRDARQVDEKGRREVAQHDEHARENISEPFKRRLDREAVAGIELTGSRALLPA